MLWLRRSWWNVESMYPEDRVLVGVVNRKRDLKTIRAEHWYRIPQKRMSRGIHAEYLAFFLSGRVFKEQSGGIHYYARVKGVELRYRRDLLPREADHPRADEVYYRVALGDLQEKSPPVLNPSRRPIAFVHTTWDRFVKATTIKNLYSEADYYVDRIYHALRSNGIRSERFWEDEKLDYAPGVRVLCESGAFTASFQSGDYQLNTESDGDEIVKQIMAEIKKRGGPATINIPYD